MRAIARGMTGKVGVHRCPTRRSREIHLAGDAVRKPRATSSTSCRAWTTDTRCSSPLTGPDREVAAPELPRRSSYRATDWPSPPRVAYAPAWTRTTIVCLVRPPAPRPNPRHVQDGPVEARMRFREPPAERVDLAVASADSGRLKTFAELRRSKSGFPGEDSAEERGL